MIHALFWNLAGMRRVHRAMMVASVAVLVSLMGTSAAGANGVPLEKGDVLAGVGNGIIKHFNSSGTLLDEINNGRETTYVTGMCFDSKSNLYATDFDGGMSKFDESGNLLVSEFGEGFGADPESCAVDSADDVYVGQADGEAKVLKFDTSGKLLASYEMEREDRGTDWIDLAADGCTIHYTSEGDEIKAFNVCTDEQLPPVATELPGPCYAHRILADGSELVACSSVVEHVNAAGEIIKTYEPGGTGSLFALNLDPDGITFWTGDLFSGEVWRINIATGDVVTTFNAGVFTALGGLTVVGEITQTSRIELSPVSAENPVGTTHTVTATVTEGGKAAEGVSVTFTVTGANPQTGEGTTNSSGQATFTYEGKTAGTDEIVASFKDKGGETHESNQATKVWTSTGGKPTETTTSLSGGGSTGGNITVEEGTPVSDTATITGVNASSASGTVTYRVYADSRCEGTAIGAGTEPVVDGSGAASESETLAPGTYYWQASYSGDEDNEASTSECGSEVETVEEPGPPPPECTMAVGKAIVSVRKEGELERHNLSNRLSTNLAAKQKLVYKWESGASKFTLTKLTKATCEVKPTSKLFSGKAEGAVDGEGGWIAEFRIRTTNKGGYTFHIAIKKPKEQAIRFTDKAKELSSEKIS